MRSDHRLAAAIVSRLMIPSIVRCIASASAREEQPFPETKCRLRRRWSLTLVRKSQIGNMTNVAPIRALANERRLMILKWLKDPTAHFPPQVDGDLVEDGVCGF